MGISIKSAADSTLICYSDSDWAGCRDSRRSTGGFCMLLGSNVISWSAQRHETVSKSSTEAEYRTMSAATSEIVWLQNLLKVMGLQQQRLPLLLFDNLSAVCLTTNPRFHKRSKHFDIDYHYVRERVALKALEVKHIPASLQLADVFTKSLSQEPFFKWRNKLGVSFPPTPSLRRGIRPSDLKPTSMSGPELKNVDHVSQPVKPTENTALAVSVHKGGLSQKSNTRSCRVLCTESPAHYTNTLAQSTFTFNRFGCLDVGVC